MIQNMFVKSKVYYAIEIKDDDGSYRFICSYSSFNEAKEKVDELESLCNNNNNNLYRILRVEKNIEEVQQGNINIMYLNDAIFKQMDSSFDDVVNSLRNDANLIANVYFNKKKIFQSSVKVYEDRGYLIASIDARFAINQDNLHVDNIVIEVSKGDSKDVLFSSETAACTVLGNNDYDADLYFKIVNVMPNNELKCPVPESRFNTMNSDLFEKIDYDNAEALTNNSKIDAGGAETVIDKDKEHNTDSNTETSTDAGTEAGTETGDIGKDTPSEDNVTNGEQEEPNNA